MSSAGKQSEDRKRRASKQPSETSQQDVKGKILLPRPTQGWPQATSSPKRTSHACDRCRIMKIKCSGGLRCKKCATDDQVCVYGDGKREKNRKGLAESLHKNSSLEDENNRLVTALKTICSDPRISAIVSPEIHDLVAKYPIDPQLMRHSEASSSVTPDIFSPITETGKEDAGETTTSARVGSPGAQDELSSVVDLGSGAGAAGFVGKISEVSWIQRCREILFRKSAGGVDISQRDLDLHLLRAQDLNYHMDDVELLSIDEEHIDALEWPPLERAKVLSKAYFESLHTVFPFIDQDQFNDVMNHFPRHTAGLSWDERRWLSMANLVFGLGSRWTHLSFPDSADGADDHLMYYARARALGLDHRLLFDHPTLEQVQALGVLAIYLFVNNSIARAWTILGHAIRHATALGLQLRVTAGSISPNQKAIRSRTWWALYSMEITLAEFTGRPASVTTLDVSAPIDAMRVGANLNSDQQTQLLVDGIEGQSSPVARSFSFSGAGTPPSHFSCRVRLAILSHRIYSALYSVGGDMSWSDVQDCVRQFNIELQQWQSKLPPELTVAQMQPLVRTADPRIELAMYYWSVRMILYRPCLCAMEGRIENESKASRDFNHAAALACIEAALAMLGLMPDTPDVGEAYRVLPWWSLLHYVCQAAAVLILELTLGVQHCPSQIGELLDGLRKAMLYLRMMSLSSLSAFKAWRVCRQTMTDATNRLGIDSDHIEAMQPPEWTLAYEASLAKALDGRGEQPYPKLSQSWGRLSGTLGLEML